MFDIACISNPDAGVFCLDEAMSREGNISNLQIEAVFPQPHTYLSCNQAIIGPKTPQP